MLATSVARADEQVDPNAPGVARISIVQGSVAVQRGDSAQPVEAAVNAPVLGADYITTGDNARAEVQFDAVSSVRLGDNVQMRFTRIDPNDRELQLAEGTVEVRLLRGDDGSATVDTPSISVRAQDGGSYRVSVDADGRTSVTVREGAAQIITPQGQQDLQPGTTLVASGTASDPQIDTTQAIAMDGFDAFNQDCDTHEQVALEDDHVVPQMQGVADLDNDGRWVDDSQSGYGEAWIPNDVPADWAPYRVGRGKTPTAGRGSVRNRGAGRRTTTAAGTTARVSAGPGIPDRVSIPLGLPPTSRSSASTWAACRSISVSATSAGCRSGRVKSSTRGGAAATPTATSRCSTSTGSRAIATTAGA